MFRGTVMHKVKGSETLVEIFEWRDFWSDPQQVALA